MRGKGRQPLHDAGAMSYATFLIGFQMLFSLLFITRAMDKPRSRLPVTFAKTNEAMAEKANHVFIICFYVIVFFFIHLPFLLLAHNAHFSLFELSNGIPNNEEHRRTALSPFLPKESRNIRNDDMHNLRFRKILLCGNTLLRLSLLVFLFL